MPRTTARITCGFANAIDGSSMSIALSLRLLRGGGAMRACCTPIYSTAPAGPDMISSSARSTAIRRIRPRTLPRWQGFTEVGQATIHQGSKTVRYLAVISLVRLIARRRNRPRPRPLATGAIDRELLK